MDRQSLDYERVIDIDSGDTLGYYAEGHVDKEEFAYTILNEEDEVASVEKICYGYMIKRPLEEDDSDEYCAYKLDFSLKQRAGWEPVTFWGDLL